MSPCVAPALGAHPCCQGGVDGVHFSVWAPDAHGVDVCLFEPGEPIESRRVALQPAGDGVWSAFVPGVGAGQLYGLRASGPWLPEAGHRFNPARLLLDPWALALVGDTERLALQTGHACADPLHPTQAWNEHQPDPNDNAAHMPRCVVVDAQAELAAGMALAPRPAMAGERVVIYEAHVKALTRLHPEVPEADRGTYRGLAHPAVVQHLQRLGITTVCLLPVHQHISERHLIERGLSNHWGYNTLNAFAPEPAYAAASADDTAAVRAEFRHMVDTLHRAGIEVVLDVVFNHTAESDLNGPTLSWRGLGQTSWYAMGEHGVPHNFSGTGNSLAFSEPRVQQWVMDSLRWWVQAFGVDGFRFDLAVSLGRDAALGHAFNPRSALMDAMAQDPVLRGVRLIAEPWDVGPNGYHMGGFEAGWLEWNDRFRDGVRAFWLGHHGTRGELATRTCASGDVFNQRNRLPTASVNMVTAHDGFNLADLTAHQHKHNTANGEDNRDGHGHNLSANAGVEGATNDPVVLHRRGLWRRALLATLFCAQGTPQLLAGDELGHSQQGNNNCYCQDNATTWLDWAQADTELIHFVAGLAALRRQHPGLCHARWFSGEGTTPDITWLDTDGHPMRPEAWQARDRHTLTALVTVGEGDAPPLERLLLVWHADHGHCTLQLPPGDWSVLLDSARARVALPGQARDTAAGRLALHEAGVWVLVQGLHAAGDTPPGLP
ncbi:glycogen debranching protein GlgX [Hydrogenophaga sp.]|uniref:glycogen debranching protein GlgX n=1 Tax=Hydrogenophaga sp. TaxID=1904254 RepID=UPI002730612F|nr:glycogen debranching protein GlgX [Hydrogenophaga sp.]MDP2018521.1 glycogen debranching protein GlgX [Hydrogenophaga sp.]MDP3167326.1 glycogen debranching protein GlgX [Hydrogenophaga sp.]MDP3809698.1 glycogen debranching protein GlgX [Hydrogenophaga sp.]